MKKIGLFVILVSIVMGGVLFNPVRVLAVPTPTPQVIDIGPQGQFSDLGKITFASLVAGAIKFVLVIAALIFFFTLVIGGVQWIISGGDKTGAETARKRISSALIGLAIVFVAWAIVSLINALFGVDIFKMTIPSFQPSS